MTYDVVALLPRMPDLADLVAGLLAAGEELRVARTANGNVLQLFDDTGLPVLSVEVPILVQVDGEVRRLLEIEPDADPPVPLWWVQTRAPSARPGAAERAWALANEFATRTGGMVWPRTRSTVDE